MTVHPTPELAETPKTLTNDTRLRHLLYQLHDLDDTINDLLRFKQRLERAIKNILEE